MTPISNWTKTTEKKKTFYKFNKRDKNEKEKYKKLKKEEKNRYRTELYSTKYMVLLSCKDKIRSWLDLNENFI